MARAAAGALMPVHELYGSRVESSLALPGVAHAIGDGPVDVRIRFDARPDDAEAWSESVVRPVYVSERAPDGVPVLVADRPGAGELLRMRYAEGMRFHVSEDGRDVWCDWRAPLTEQDAFTFLLGPVMGVVLRRHGTLALHASAVVISGGAWAFVGPGGSGKSTVAAALAQAGHAVLTEDVLALRPHGQGWLAFPGYRSVRLWEDAAALIRTRTELPPLSPTWPKRELDLAGEGLSLSRDSVPLAGLFVLEDYGPVGAPPAARPIPAAALLVELVANVYMNYLASGPDLARELAACRALASSRPGWWLRPGAGGDGLAETVRLIDERATGR